MFIHGPSPWKHLPFSTRLECDILYCWFISCSYPNSPILCLLYIPAEKSHDDPCPQRIASVVNPTQLPSFGWHVSLDGDRWCVPGVWRSASHLPRIWRRCPRRSPGPPPRDSRDSSSGASWPANGCWTWKWDQWSTMYLKTLWEKFIYKNRRKQYPDKIVQKKCVYYI